MQACVIRGNVSHSIVIKSPLGPVSRVTFWSFIEKMIAFRAFLLIAGDFAVCRLSKILNIEKRLANLKEN